MDKRHSVPADITAGATVVFTGLIKARGKSEFVPLTRQKTCHVGVEVEDMDVTAMAYDELADTLAGLATATVIHATGKLHVAQWNTGDGRLHHKVAVRLETIDAPG